MKLTTEQKDQIKKLQDNSDLDMDLLYFIEDSDAEDIDELTDHLQDQQAFDVEIIYYANAMDYLRENDPSLQFSTEIAHNMGYEAKNTNSELLASLLASENEREAYEDIKNELEEILFPEEEYNN